MNHFSDFIVSKIKAPFIYNWSTPDPDESTFSSTLETVYSLNSTIPGFPREATWEEFVAFKRANLMERLLREMKSTRNQLLQQSDWVLTYDNVQTLANLDAWVSYRKTLRDFFSSPSFQIILVPGTEQLDYMAMNFPPPQPPLIRK
jgi:hypothetical protein